MLSRLAGTVGERKGILYVCGGLRTLWALLYHDGSRNAVEVAERAVDGAATEDEVMGANAGAEGAGYGCDFDPRFIRQYMAGGDYSPGVRRLVEMGVFTEAGLRAVVSEGAEVIGDQAVVDRLNNAAHIAEHGTETNNLGWCEGGASKHLTQHLAAEPDWPGGWLVREVFGNPFRPIAFHPSWLTPTAVGIARGVYDDRAFDRLPILADALQDAGCEDEQVLAHCRGGGPHVRGCWVVDGVLGLK
jgi:hypothetical protein